MRVKVQVNIAKPLRRGMKVAVESGCTKWIGFKYERLGDFCYYCGQIGHTDKDCEEKEGGVGESPVVFQYGPFLTASPYRSKVSEIGREKEKKWFEHLNSKGRVQRSDYNDPKAIRLGPPGAARKLLLSPQGAPHDTTPKPRTSCLKAVASDGDGKMVLRPVSVQAEFMREPGQGTVEKNVKQVAARTMTQKEGEGVYDQVVDMDITEGLDEAAVSKKRGVEDAELGDQLSDVCHHEKKLKRCKPNDTVVESVLKVGSFGTAQAPEKQ
uniref:CCHC-type domain-containing protein n=1 Tax=Chenopodium quinoa TaxID=63459 RepID=A0A803MDE5_CHEQI